MKKEVAGVGEDVDVERGDSGDDQSEEKRAFAFSCPPKTRVSR